MALDTPTYRLSHPEIPMDGSSVLFNSGLDIPAGMYRLRYDGGALYYQDDYMSSGSSSSSSNPHYQVNYMSLEGSSSSSNDPYYQPDPDEHLGFLISSIDAVVPTSIVCPGGYSYYASKDDCEVSVLNTNEVIPDDYEERSDFIDFSHPGGRISISLYILDYSIVSSETTQLPKFSMTRITDNQLDDDLHHNQIMYDYNCDGVDHTFSGTTRNLFFPLHRRTDNDGNILNNMKCTLTLTGTNKTFEIWYGESLKYTLTPTPGPTPYSLDINGDNEYDHIMIKVYDTVISNQPANGHEYTINMTQPTLDSPDPRSATIVSPTDASGIQLSPTRIELDWDEHVDQDDQLEEILGWDIYLAKSDTSFIPTADIDYYIGSTTGSITSFILPTLEKNSSYKWWIIPYSSSYNGIGISNDTIVMWSFETSDDSVDIYSRDDRSTNINPLTFNVDLNWSLFGFPLSIAPDNPVVGDQFLVSTLPLPTGDWLGEGGNIASWIDDPLNPGIEIWEFSSPDTDQYSDIVSFGVYYSFSARNGADNWIAVDNVEKTIATEYNLHMDLLTDLPDWPSTSSRYEAIKAFTGKSDNILKFKVIAFNIGFLRNESCGIAFAVSNEQYIKHFSTKKQLYINLDGTYIGNGVLGVTKFEKFHTYDECEFVWDSDVMNTSFSLDGTGLWDPSRITIDNNRHTTNRPPSIWAAFRDNNNLHKKGNGVAKFDYYTGLVDKYWQEDGQPNHSLIHNGGTRGITLSSSDGDAYCGSPGNYNVSHLQTDTQVDAIETHPPGNQSNYGATHDQFDGIWYIRADLSHPGISHYNPITGGTAYYDFATDFPGTIDHGYCVTTDTRGGIWVSGYDNTPYIKCIRLMPQGDNTVINTNYISIPFNTTPAGQCSGIICDLEDSNGYFNIWMCQNQVNLIHKFSMKHNADGTIDFLSHIFFSCTDVGAPIGWRPHGIAIDSDNNIWVAPIGHGTIKIYQKTDSTLWGDGMKTQGGYVRYSMDYEHEVYDQWDTGIYDDISGYDLISDQTDSSSPYHGLIIGNTIYNPPYRFIAYDQLSNEKLYPGFDTASAAGYTGYKAKFFSESTGSGKEPISTMYMYSDFTGQVMKLYSSQSPVFETTNIYEPVWKRTS